MSNKDRLFDTDFVNSSDFWSDFWDTNTIHELWDLIEETKWKSWEIIWKITDLKESGKSDKVKNDHNINNEFWGLIMNNKNMFKQYLDMAWSFENNWIKFKEIFIKILKIDNSNLKEKDKIINFIFEIIKRKDYFSYRKFVYKYFSYIKKRNRKIPKDVVDSMFEMIKLFENIFEAQKQ